MPETCSAMPLAMYLPLGLAVLVGYLLGSVPFGLLLTRAAGLGDIRSIGSGNIGATNVLRTGNKALAIATLLLDGGKAALAFGLVFWAAKTGWLGQGAQPHPAGLLAGLAAFVGHCFPVWLKFKGGKGVATYFGLLLAAVPPIGALAGLVWLATAFITRLSSLAALLAAALTPLIAYLLKADSTVIGISVALAVLVFWRHEANIARLARGEEPKIGAAKAAATPPADPS